jgi:hypothetical protein
MPYALTFMPYRLCLTVLIRSFMQMPCKNVETMQLLRLVYAGALLAVGSGQTWTAPPPP